MKITTLTPLSYRQDGEYRFQLTAPFHVRVDAFAGRTYQDKQSFSTYTSSEAGEISSHPWLTLGVSGDLTVSSGYAWDGCSPAAKMFGQWLGTPTPPSVRAACLVHDALYQFLDQNYWTRAEADAAFLALMQQAGFRLAPIYYGAVRIFGGLHHLLFR